MRRSLPSISPFGKVLIAATIVFAVAAAFTTWKPVLLGLAVVIAIWILVMITHGPPSPEPRSPRGAPPADRAPARDVTSED